MTAPLRHAIGSFFVVGLNGTELTNLERSWLRLVRPAGIILFRRNIADAKQTRTLLAESTSFCASHSLRCVDVEGGTVDRLRDALAPMPSAQFVAQCGKAKLARQHGTLIARAVSAFGFNTTLAPVLDLALPESASVMGTRTTSSSPTEVAAYTREFLAGLHQHHITGCAKHFPGLGAGSLDSHLDTPSIHRTLQILWNSDLLPYRELHTILPMVMVNHAAYPATQSRQLPASISSFWITTILRKRIGYRGIIFSDDLEMGGILKHMPIEEAVLAAVRAGTDLLEICHSPELILRGYESLLVEAERSSAFASLLKSRAQRAARIRAKQFPIASPKPLTTTQFESLRNTILNFSAQIASLHEEPRP